MMKVEVITPEKVFLVQDEVAIATLNLTSGTYEVREKHAPFMANLTSGSMLLEKEDDSELVVLLHGGFVQIADNLIKVVTNAAEMRGNIDFTRAKESKDKAEARINNPASVHGTFDLRRAKESLKRAKARLAMKESK